MDTGRGALGHGHWKRDTRAWTLARDTRTWALEEGHYDIDTGRET